MTTLVKISIAIGDFSSGREGNGIVKKDTRIIDEDFTSIASSEGLNVYITQASEFSVLVEADENIIDLIGTDVTNGRLKIHAIKNIGNATKNVYVTLPKISELKSSSGSVIQTKNTIKSSRLNVDSSSGSILNAEIDTDNLVVDASSGANISLSGAAGNTEVDASSGSNINAKALDIKYCDAEASSGSNVSISVTESLNANASSGGNISYSGKAKLTTKKSVSGSVTFNE